MPKTVKWGSVRVSRGLDLGVALGITAIVALWAIAANRRVKQLQTEQTQQPPAQPPEGTVFL